MGRSSSSSRRPSLYCLINGPCFTGLTRPTLSTLHVSLNLPPTQPPPPPKILLEINSSPRGGIRNSPKTPASPAKISLQNLRALLPNRHKFYSEEGGERGRERADARQPNHQRERERERERRRRSNGGEGREGAARGEDDGGEGRRRQGQGPQEGARLPLLPRRDPGSLSPFPDAPLATVHLFLGCSRLRLRKSGWF